MKRKTLVAAVAVALIAGVAVLARHRLFGSPAIRVGTVVPLTGPDGPVGLGMRNAMRLAIDQVNARGGVQGRPVELVALDEDPDHAITLQRVKQLADDPRILGASAHYRDDWQVFAGETYRGAELANVIPGAIEVEQTTDMLRWMPESFRLVPTNKAQMVQAREYLWQIVGARKPLVVRDNSYFGLRMGIVLSEELLHYLPLLPDDVGVLPTLRDFKEIVEQAKARGYDYIHFSGEPEQAAALLTQLRAGGITAPFQFVGKYPSDEFIRLAGEKLAEGVVTTFAGLPPEYSDGGKAFLRDYAAAGFKEPPGPYGLYAYASMQTLLAAIEHSSLARASVVKELRLGQFDTALGPIRFVWKGQSSYNAIAIYKVIGGHWKPIFVTDAARQLKPVVAQ